MDRDRAAASLVRGNDDRKRRAVEYAYGGFVNVWEGHLHDAPYVQKSNASGLRVFETLPAREKEPIGDSRRELRRPPQAEQRRQPDQTRSLRQPKESRRPAQAIQS